MIVKLDLKNSFRFNLIIYNISGPNWTRFIKSIENYIDSSIITPEILNLISWNKHSQSTKTSKKLHSLPPKDEALFFIKEIDTYIQMLDICFNERHMQKCITSLRANLRVFTNFHSQNTRQNRDANPDSSSVLGAR